MAVIVKTYTFVADTVANASEVNRNFDNVYTEFNGSIDSANIKSTYTIAASNVTIVDSAALYSSAEIEGALEEAKRSNVPKGFNSIHILAQGSNGVVISPGIVDVNGKGSMLTTEITASSFVYMASDTSILGSYGTLHLCVAGVSSLSANNFYIVANAEINSSNYVASQNGFYYSTSETSSTLTLRVIGALNHVSAIGYFDYPTIDGPCTPYKKAISGNSAVCQTGFLFSSACNTFWILSLNRAWNINSLTYDYQIVSSIPSATGVYQIALAARPAVETINANFVDSSDGTIDINKIAGIKVAKRTYNGTASIFLHITATGNYTRAGDGVADLIISIPSMYGVKNK